MATSYATIEQVKARIVITTTEHDTVLTEIVAQVSRGFDTIYGEGFDSQSRKEWHNGFASGDGMLLDHIPDADTPAFDVTEDTTTLTIDTEFRVSDYPSRMLTRMEDADTVRLGGFVPGQKNVRVEYTSRFTVIPDDIERACIDESVRAWQVRNSSGASDGNRIGISNRSPEAGTGLTYTEDDFTATTMRILNAYKTQRVG